VDTTKNPRAEEPAEWAVVGLLIVKDKMTIALVLLLVILFVCNFGFVHSAGWSRWGWQILSFGGLVAVYKMAGLSLNDIGLSRSRLGTGFKYAIVAIAIIAVVFFIIYLINQNIFRDHRYDQGLSAAVKSALIIVPIQTVLFEELAFRGIIPSLIKGLNGSLLITIVVSSLLFGLWHIASAPKGELLGKQHMSNLLIIALIFLATSVGGAILYLLRYKSGSLVAPIAVHWFVNGVAIVLSSLSWMHRS
jgi:membrane protease YdiL (CAAX protease family)